MQSNLDVKGSGKRPPENNLRISLSTLMEVSTLLGHPLEDRTPIRQAQDPALLQDVMQQSARLVDSPVRQERFYFGCLDFLMYQREGQWLFSPLEMNGTGMVGLTNLPLFVMERLLNTLSDIPSRLSADAPLILVPYSGTYKLATSGTSQLIHERILYAQAMKEAFQRLYGKGMITGLPRLETNPGVISPGMPMVVLGYVKDLFAHLSVSDGRLMFFGRPVAAAMHDQFCDYVLQHYGAEMDPDGFKPVNHIFPVATDKGGMYQVYNRMIRAQAFPSVSDPVHYDLLPDRDALVDYVLDALADGRKLVIKPHAGGLGRGIEFFIAPESRERTIEKIDASITSMEKFYGVAGAVFPYTVCDYIDSRVIDAPTHPFHGHKFELRMMVIRDGDSLQAVPSIVKVASVAYDPAHTERLMLLNNIDASKKAHNRSGLEFMLPLGSPDTLSLLGITMEQLTDLCRFTTAFVEHVLETVPVHEQWQKIHSA